MPITYNPLPVYSTTNVVRNDPNSFMASILSLADFLRQQKLRKLQEEMMRLQLEEAKNNLAKQQQFENLFSPPLSPQTAQLANMGMAVGGLSGIPAISPFSSDFSTVDLEKALPKAAQLLVSQGKPEAAMRMYDLLEKSKLRPFEIYQKISKNLSPESASKIMKQIAPEYDWSEIQALPDYTISTIKLSDGREVYIIKHGNSFTTIKPENYTLTEQIARLSAGGDAKWNELPNEEKARLLVSAAQQTQVAPITRIIQSSEGLPFYVTPQGATPIPGFPQKEKAKEEMLDIAAAKNAGLINSTDDWDVLTPDRKVEIYRNPKFLQERNNIQATLVGKPTAGAVEVKNIMKQLDDDIRIDEKKAYFKAASSTAMVYNRIQNIAEALLDAMSKQVKTKEDEEKIKDKSAMAMALIYSFINFLDESVVKYGEIELLQELMPPFLRLKQIAGKYTKGMPLSEETVKGILATIKEIYSATQNVAKKNIDSLFEITEVPYSDIIEQSPRLKSYIFQRKKKLYNEVGLELVQEQEQKQNQEISDDVQNLPKTLDISDLLTPPKNASETILYQENSTPSMPLIILNEDTTKKWKMTPKKKK